VARSLVEKLPAKSRHEGSVAAVLTQVRSHQPTRPKPADRLRERIEGWLAVPSISGLVDVVVVVPLSGPIEVAQDLKAKLVDRKLQD
jgi:hypothetical protein